MPYIPQEDRGALFHRIVSTPGELNYLLTMGITVYLKEKGLSYQTINDINGALEGAKIEFNRRVTAPYEDRKISENGDVYPKEVT